eukprot:ANDGO_00428.mRNA.1 Muscle calcium channel subunit alpha-1
MTLLQWPWFDRFILVAIVTNCAFLAAYDPTEKDTERNRICDTAGYAFTAIFASEMCIKIFAMGFILNDHAYIRDGWNVLDFTVVVTSLAEIVVGTGVSAIRALRVLRPLRTISAVPQLRIIVDTLIKSVKNLANAAALFVFFFVLFSLTGVQLFQGLFHQQCYQATDISVLDSTEPDARCSVVDTGRHCPAGYTCLPNSPNPNFGITSFDNMGWALIVVFQCLTMEGWTQIMYFSQDAYAGSTAIYFILIIFLGSFFLVQLTLAVVNDIFESATEHEKELEERIADVENEKHETQGARFAEITREAVRASKNGTRKGEDMQEISFSQNSSKASESSTVESKRSESDSETDISEVATHPWPLLVLARLRKRLRRVISSRYFVGFISVMILLNTVVLAMDYYPESEAYANALWTANVVFTAVFVAELVIKFIALGPKQYVSDRFNIFDAVVVVFSVLELIIGDSNGLSVLRIFRLMRLFKLVRSWKSLNSLLETIARSIASVAWLSMLLLLVIFIFALLGMSLFGGNVQVDGEVPRSNFDTIYWSMITVFQILTGENWNEVMYNCITGTSWGAAFYFVGVVCVGNYLILNLFIAILLGNISPEDSGDENTATLEYSGDADASKEPSGPLGASVVPLPTTSIKDGSDTEQEEEENTRSVSKQQVESREDAGCTVFSTSRNKSLCMFSENSRVRQFSHRLMEHWLFETVVLLCIFCSAVTLAMENPNDDPQSEQSIVLNDVNLALTVIFTLEMVIKVVAMGFVFHEKAYLRDNWNKLDFVVVIVSLASSAQASEGLQVVKVLRILRILRPLRLVGKAAGMRVVVDTLVRSVPPILSVFLIFLILLTVFGILGVQLFAGKFYRCNDLAVETKNQCTGNFTDLNGSTIQRDWSQPMANFDNFGNSILTLIGIMGTEGWTDVMYDGIDATDYDRQPRRNNNPANALFFVSWIVVITFFMVNLFVGVLIDKYFTLKEEAGANGSLLLTDVQKKWIELHRSLWRSKPSRKLKEPVQKWRKPFFRMVSSKPFDLFIAFIIILNILVMCIEHYQQSDSVSQFLEISNICFTSLFVLEAILKNVGLGPRQYFSSGWNCFDFFIVIISVIAFFVNTGIGVSIFRLFRVLRLFRLVKSAKGIRMLLKTLLWSLPSLSNVGSLLALLFFTYAVLGVNFFVNVKYGVCLDRHANFETFGNALLTLMRMITGESWNCIMYDCMVQPPNCSHEEGNCGSPAAPLYFITFVVLGATILLNVFIAVILENFATVSNDEQNTITENDIEEYAETWQAFDPGASGYIPLRELPKLIETLSAPLGAGRALPRKKMMNWVSSLHVRVHLRSRKVIDAEIGSEVDGLLEYNELLIAMAKRILGPEAELPEEMEEVVDTAKPVESRQPSRLFSGLLTRKTTDTAASSETGMLATEIGNDAQRTRPQIQYTAAEYYAALAVQRGVRAFLKRKRERLDNP